MAGSLNTDGSAMDDASPALPRSRVAHHAADLVGPGPVAAYLALCVIWGSTFLGIRIAVETIPPWTMIGVRSVIAGLVLTGVALAIGAARPTRWQVASAAVSGILLFVGGQSLLAWGETRLESGQAAILGCTVSLFTPILSWLIGASSRPGLLASAGLLIGFLGVAVLAGTGSSTPDGVACIAVLLSQAIWALGASVARRWPAGRSALLGSGMQLLAGGAASTALGFMYGDWGQIAAHGVSGRSIAAFFYLIVMGSLVGFACFGWLVQVWRPERVSTYAFVNPVVALGISVAVAGETVGLREVVAVGIILSAVALVMFGRRIPLPSWAARRPKIAGP